MKIPKEGNAWISVLLVYEKMINVKWQLAVTFLHIHEIGLTTTAQP